MEENYQVKAFDMILDRLHSLEDKVYEYKSLYVESSYYSLEFNKLTQDGWMDASWFTRHYNFR